MNAYEEKDLQRIRSTNLNCKRHSRVAFFNTREYITFVQEGGLSKKKKLSDCDPDSNFKSTKRITHKFLEQGK